MQNGKIFWIQGGLIAAAFWWLLPASEARSEQSARLVVRRATLPNFITDEVVNRALSGNEVSLTHLPSTFELKLPSTEQTFVWSPALCRLIGIRRGNQSTFVEAIAEGVHPFSVSSGASGNPAFFGFRLVNGSPEFLYTYGQLSIEERFEVTPDGRRLYQHFKIASSNANTSYTVPEAWRKILTADNGRWVQTTLTLNRQETKDGFVVTYHLDPQSPRPGTPPPLSPSQAQSQP